MSDQQDTRPLSKILEEIHGSKSSELTDQQRTELRRALLHVTKKRIHVASTREARLLKKARETYRRPLTATVR